MVGPFLSFSLPPPLFLCLSFSCCLCFSNIVFIPFTEPEVPIEPPSATTTTTIGISATSPTFSSAFGKKRAGTTTVPSSSRKTRKNKGKEASAAGDSGLHLQEAPQGQGAKQAVGANGDSDHLDNTDCTSESSGSSSSGSGGGGGGGSSTGEKSHSHNHRHPPDTHPTLSTSSSSSSSSGAGPSSSSAPTHTGSTADKRQGPQHSGREDKLISSKNQQRYETNLLKHSGL